MSALSVKPSHKAQSMLLGPPRVYLCRQEGSEPTRTATSTYPSIHPSFSNHLFSLSISVVLFIPYRSFYPLLWHILCHCWCFLLTCTHQLHIQKGFLFLCVCVGFCAASWFESVPWRIRFLYQSSICALFISPSQQLSEQMQFSLALFISSNTFFCAPVLNCHVSPCGRLVLTVACQSCLILIAF